MDSPLDPSFSKFYMANLQNKIFNKINNPTIYARYISDIFIQNKSVNDSIELWQRFRFKAHLWIDKDWQKLPFLDILIDHNSDNFATFPYKKSTSSNSCFLNYSSEFPEKYKTAVINKEIQWAKLISTGKIIFLKISKYKTLINNGYPNSIVDKQISFKQQ